MPIVAGTGRIFDAATEAIVITVNTEGVMGKGIAKAAKALFPEEAAKYERACRQGFGPGEILRTYRADWSRAIIFFATKDKWRNRSEYAWIEKGLRSLAIEMRDSTMDSIAIPALGCANGGLDWARVEPMIREAFKDLPKVTVHLYGPGEGIQ